MKAFVAIIGFLLASVSFIVDLYISIAHWDWSELKLFIEYPWTCVFTGLGMLIGIGMVYIAAEEMD
jgi:hypothetical protein